MAVSEQLSSHRTNAGRLPVYHDPNVTQGEPLPSQEVIILRMFEQELETTRQMVEQEFPAKGTTIRKPLPLTGYSELYAWEQSETHAPNYPGLAADFMADPDPQKRSLFARDAVALAQAGSFEELYEYYHTYIEGKLRSKLLFKFSLSEADADDIIMDMWIKVLEKVQSFSFRSDVKPYNGLEAWMTTIAVHKVYDKWRVRHDEELDPEDELDIEDTVDVTASWDHPDVKLALMNISVDRQRRAVIMRYFLNCDYHEISRIIGVDRAATRAVVFRGIESMRSTLRTLAQNGHNR